MDSKELAKLIEDNFNKSMDELLDDIILQRAEMILKEHGLNAVTDGIIAQSKEEISQIIECMHTKMHTVDEEY